MPLTLHVVSHTHWDREWYQPFQVFRLRLVDLIDHLLEILEADPAFKHFHLDSQTIVLEDYLQIRPEARARLEGHIRAGRIAVGPWYQLNDEFLTSGEATVRSLLVGSRIAREFGGEALMDVGYLPDQFGHISQMPQILAGFGIDNAVIGRGYQLRDGRHIEFKWESPDGTQALTSLMAWWYNNAQYIPKDPDEAVRFVLDLRDRMRAHSHASHLLLMNGVDHLEPQAHIGQLIQQVNARLEERGIPDRLVHSSLHAYLHALKDELQQASPVYEVKQGELREDRGGAVLAGTLSTRMYLKQANYRAQTCLERYAEPLSAYARVNGAQYPADALRFAWKLLMQNHPHDSICGCSIDQVHNEMLPRFDQVVQVGEELTERALDCLTGRDRALGAPEAPGAVTVFNTLNWERTDPVRVTLDFALGPPGRGNAPRDDSRAPSAFLLLGPDGQEVPYAVTRRETLLRTVTNPHELPLDQWVHAVTIEFVAKDVPACGYATYRIQVVQSPPQYPAQPRGFVPTSHIELEDCGDVGDEYLHRKPLRDEVFGEGVTYRPDSIETNAVRATRSHTVDLHLPVSATEDRQARSAAKTACRVVTRMTHWADVPRIEFETTVDNTAKDHRLRVRFLQYRHRENPRSVAETAFDVVERPLENPDVAHGAAPFNSQMHWCALMGADDRGELATLTVVNRGLPEYEAFYEPTTDPEDPSHGTIALTLLRCVGQLSGRGDGPGIPTPGAQCLGTHTFHYALLETAGDWIEGEVWKQAHQFAVPLLAVHHAAADRPLRRSFLQVEPGCLIVTAVKRAEDRDTLIVRFFNTVAKSVQGTAEMQGAARCRLVNLDERPVSEWIAGGRWTGEVGPKQIVTLEFELP